ncbi:MAG: hypothetical protein CTY35_01975 [Methylotenera sp.]|uniref:hypothetical protein n=1 Tax=Methylotenera sp. TaxID=2051956 RepID=UPI000D463D82|nr:hypothetical protein [Methylotenera sp.]PPC84397.1 MAG: hypothetical protein CTY38_02195 [Methylotenera sp.]PPD01039.1 MAG: hypothetical protein CTY35_01975 [Methylotenera sp.]
MRHHYTTGDNSGNHWAVGVNSSESLVLVQIQHNDEQVRLPMTVMQARAFAKELIRNADKVESQT